jgi:D-alanyl-D-alanine carboxypeptidase
MDYNRVMSKFNIKKLQELSPTAWGIVALAVLLVAGAIYSVIRISLLSGHIAALAEHVESLETNFASTTAMLQENITKNHNALATALTAEQQNVGTIREQLGIYKDQVGSITGTVTNLQKLSKTDPQLLAKYSKVFFLSENYAPARLTQVPDIYKYSEGKTVNFLAEAWPYLQRMIDDAGNAGVKIYVSSAYRSFDEQSALKKDYKIVYGAGTANQFSADQGYSEHQLGTAVDLIAPGLGGQLDGFDGTAAYTWLLANAYRYGFILSYPKNNKYYVFEPWHWRFVGVKLATYLHNENFNFYDLEQRKIDEFLVSFFD